MTQATTVDGRGSSPERTPSNEKPSPSSGGGNADGDPSKAPQGPIEKEDALERAYQFPAAAVVEALGSDETQGLSDAEAKRRPEEYGPNQLEGGDEISKIQILIHQVANAMTLVSVPRRVRPPKRRRAAELLGARAISLLRRNVL